MRGFWLAALMLGACATAPDLPDSARVEGIDWKLVAVNGAPSGEDVSLRIDGARISGIGPCNVYAADQSAAPPGFAARAITTTRMACAPARLRAEGSYLDLLSHVTERARDGAALILSGPDLTLHFVRREARGDNVF